MSTYLSKPGELTPAWHTPLPPALVEAKRPEIRQLRFQQSRGDDEPVRIAGGPSHLSGPH